MENIKSILESNIEKMLNECSISIGNIKDEKTKIYFLKSLEEAKNNTLNTNDFIEYINTLMQKK